MSDMHTYTTAEAAELLELSQRQIQRLAKSSGPLAALRRTPVLILEGRSVDAYRVVKEGGPTYADGTRIEVGDRCVVDGLVSREVVALDGAHVHLFPVRGYGVVHVHYTETADRLELEGADR